VAAGGKHYNGSDRNWVSEGGRIEYLTGSKTKVFVVMVKYRSATLKDAVCCICAG
jgi:Holliday junction resolvase-like predicted endonuclease